ncbi:MAG: inositol monophosphatase family protein [Spirochaetales bacterium]|uniref:Inositol-1-monophosphatase n=1 Tax=Candidatus Thalassospirochaeta sargassi TaxID=3119039 RepID=A0AAJ1ML56_9SPIO|nr:inositol monophosphatase family protein [Spirochaetales bacterium]
MSDNIEKILETAAAAAEAAGGIIMSFLNKARIDDKGVNNLVTEADISSEKAIRKIITERYPDHSIMGEEGGGEADPEAEHLWIIDPLDGTNNFAHGFPFFAVSIAYAQKGIVKVGYVYDPVHDEIFHAVKDGGAFLNGTPIKVSEQALNKALIITGFYYDRGEMMRNTLVMVQRLFEQNIRGIRRTGSAALDCCYVASGRADAYVEYQLHTWDFAAGMLIISEAGGDCRQADGRYLGIDSESIAVCNGVFTEKLIELVKYPVGV